MQRQPQPHVVSLRFDKFVLDDSMRPASSAAERLMISKSLHVVWSFVAAGSQSLLGITSSSPLRSVNNRISCGWASEKAELVLGESMLQSFAERVIMLRLVEDDPKTPRHSLEGSGGSFLRKQLSAPFASGTLDPAAFLRGGSGKEYCIKMESNFTCIGKLYFYLSIETLESKRLSDRTVVQRRLVLRVDRVVGRDVSSPLLQQARQAEAFKSPSEVRGTRDDSCFASLSHPQQVPEASVTTNASTGLTTRTSSGASIVSSSLRNQGSASMTQQQCGNSIRLGREYSVKVRLNTSKDIVRTPLSICDEDGRVRWSYELSLPLSLPAGGGSLSLDSPQPNGGSSSNTNAGAEKMQVALLDGGDVISAFAIAVDKLKTSPGRWTEFAIPAPCKWRDPKTGASMTSTVLFELSAKHVDVLKLSPSAVPATSDGLPLSGPPSQGPSSRRSSPGQKPLTLVQFPTENGFGDSISSAGSGPTPTQHPSYHPATRATVVPSSDTDAAPNYSSSLAAKLLGANAQSDSTAPCSPSRDTEAKSGTLAATLPPTHCGPQHSKHAFDRFTQKATPLATTVSFQTTSTDPYLNHSSTSRSYNGATDIMPNHSLAPHSLTRNDTLQQHPASEQHGRLPSQQVATDSQLAPHPDVIALQLAEQSKKIEDLQRQLLLLRSQSETSSANTGWGSSAAGWRSASLESRSGSVTSRRGTPQRTHSLSQEEHICILPRPTSATRRERVEPAYINEASLHRQPSREVSSAPRSATVWNRDAASPAPVDPRRTLTAGGRLQYLPQ